MALADASSVGLLFRIRADSSDAEKEIKEFSDAVEKETKDVKDKGGKNLDGFAKNLGLTASQASKAKVGIGLAIAAIAALGVAAVKASQAIFNLSNEFATLGDEIGKAQNLTGVSVETLSALKKVAEDVGVDFNGLQDKIRQFTRNLGLAALGSTEAADKMKRLGVDVPEAVNDLDLALRQVFKTLNDLPEGVARTNAAIDAFGEEGTKLLPIVAKFNGDVDAMIARARELGIVLSEEDVKASKEFKSALNDLSSAASGASATFAREFTPEVTEAINLLTKWIVDNRDDFERWGREIKGIINGVIGTFKSISDFVNGPEGQAIATFLNLILAVRGGTPVVLPSASPPRSTPPPSTTDDDQGTTDGQASADFFADIERQIQEREKLIQQQLATYRAASREILEIEADRVAASIRIAALEFENRIIDGKQFQENSLGDLEIWRNASLRILDELYDRESQVATGEEIRQLSIEKFAAQRAIINQYWDDRQAIIDQRTKLEADRAKEAAEDAKEAQEKRDADDLEAIQLQTELRVAAAEARQDAEDELNRILDERIEALERILDLERQVTDASRELADLRAEAEQRALEADVEFLSGRRREVAIEALREFLVERAELEREQRLQDLANEEEQLKIETALAIEDKEQREEALFQIEQLYKERRLIAEEEFQQRLKEIQDRIQGEEGTSIFDRFEEAAGIFDDFGDVLETVGGIAERVFGALASGIGDVVKEFVLYGKTSGEVLKKVLAQTLASIAAEAAVRAVYATALGFLRLAQWDFVAAGNAFTSAAVWASIAVGTALAGRAIAGDSFNRETASGSGSTAGQNARGGTDDQETRVIDISRNAPFRSEQGNSIVVRDKSGMLGRLFEFEIQRNSRLRRLIIDTVDKS